MRITPPMAPAPYSTPAAPLSTLDACRRKGVDLRGVVPAPLLTFLGNTGVEYQHPGAVDASQHGLRYGRSCGQGGYARQGFKRLAQGLTPAFFQFGKWQDQDGLAGPGEFARQVPFAGDGDLLAEKRLRLHADFKHLRLGFGDDHLASDRPVTDEPELDRVPAGRHVFQAEPAFLVGERPELEIGQDNGHRRQWLPGLVQHLAAHGGGMRQGRQNQAGHGYRQQDAQGFR